MSTSGMEDLSAAFRFCAVVCRARKAWRAVMVSLPRPSLPYRVAQSYGDVSSSLTSCRRGLKESCGLS